MEPKQVLSVRPKQVFVGIAFVAIFFLFFFLFALARGHSARESDSSPCSFAVLRRFFVNKYCSDFFCKHSWQSCNGMVSYAAASSKSRLRHFRHSQRGTESLGGASGSNVH